MVKSYEGIPPSVLERFEKYGQNITFLEDIESSSEFEWNEASLAVKNTTAGWTVQSHKLLTAPKEEAGMLYCKLMSPARILEFIMVDSLF